MTSSGERFAAQAFVFIRGLAHVLEALIVIPFGTIISLLPWHMVRPLGCIAGKLLFHLNRAGRQQAYRNLDVVFSEQPMTSGEKERIVRNLFMHLATVSLEYLKIGGLTVQNYERFVRFEDPWTLEEIGRVLDGGKGLLVITAHIGNWEYLGSVISKQGKNSAVVINRQLNPYTDRWLRRIRETHGKMKCFYRETSGLIRAVRHLSQNGLLGLLADEAAPAGSVRVPFFGREADTASGPARFHLRYGAPLMFFFCVKQEDGKYLLTSDGPYHFDQTGDFDNDCRAIMTLVNQKYEAIIRKYPDQWFSLFYPRWGRYTC